MCTPVAALAGGLQVAGMAAQNSAGNRYARSQQSAIDRDVKISQEQFDDRNTRVTKANNDSLALASSGYDERRGESRGSEATVAQIMRDTIDGTAGIDADTRAKRSDEAVAFNALTKGARDRQRGYRAEGETIANDAVGAFDFGKREASRGASADYRNALTQEAISGPSAAPTAGLPASIARDFATMAAGKVQQARDTGKAFATSDSYADALRSGDETIDTAAEGIDRVRRTSDSDLTGLDAKLGVHGGSYDRALTLGSERIKDLLANNQGKAGFTEDRANRVIGQSSDDEVARAGILDSWVGALNSSSTAYEEALRRNAAIKLQGTPRTSSMGSLFSAIGSGIGAYGANGQGPTWGQVGKFVSPTPTRGISGYSTTAY